MHLTIRKRISNFFERDFKFGISLLFIGAITCTNQLPPTLNQDQEIPKMSKAITGFTVDYSTYIGGSNHDGIRDIAADKFGNMFITGGTESPDFTTTADAYDTTHNGGMDVFVTKFDPQGKLVWSTFIGGPNYDRAYALEVGEDGHIYVAGRAGDGFPISPGAFQTTFMGGGGAPYGPQDGFVIKLSPNGDNLVYASYFGTSDRSMIRDLAVDEIGNAYLASSYFQDSSVPPGWDQWFSNGFQNSPQGGIDGVIAKVSANGTSVLWATYLGGTSDESGTPSIRVENDNVYYLTYTSSTDMPTTNGAYDRTFAGGTGMDIYLAKLAMDGSQLIYGTYLGGTQTEFGDTHNLEVDTQGNAYIAATTLSADFPTTQQAYQTTYGGSGGTNGNYPGDAIVAKISSDGSELLASTFIGGSSGEGAEGVSVDDDGNVYFSGSTHSSNLPVTIDAAQSEFQGKLDMFAVQLSNDFSQLSFSTYLGGNDSDDIKSSFFDELGNFYVAGRTDSIDWPTNKAFQETYGGNKDGAFVKLHSMQNNPFPTYIPIIIFH